MLDHRKVDLNAVGDVKPWKRRLTAVRFGEEDEGDADPSIEIAIRGCL